MRYALRSILLIALVAPTGAAVAGPVEDGYAAYEVGDYPAALQLWRPLAEQGIDDAQVALAMTYFYGNGVPQDYVQAYLWYDLAAAHGDKAALTDRDLVAAQMTRAQIAEAQTLAREWKPGR